MALDKTVLKTRSLTALFFGLTVTGLLLAGNFTTSLLLLAVAVWTTHEYLSLVAQGRNITYLTGFILFISSATAVIFFKEEILTFSLTPVIFSLIYLVFIANIFFGFINYRYHFWWIVIFYPGLGCILYMLQLDDVSVINAGFMLWLILMIWVCDSFQYLFGARFGKRKLLERVSPKKSWEGFIGGGLVVICFSLIPGKYAGVGSYTFWLTIALVVWIIGTLGDLFESTIKRQFGVKDSGSFLPGHGGMLDRFDSFVFIIPFVLLTIYYMA